MRYLLALLIVGITVSSDGQSSHHFDATAGVAVATDDTLSSRKVTPPAVPLQLVAALEQLPMPAIKPEQQPQSIPSDAVSAALEDAKRLTPAELILTRWIWIDSGQAEDFKAVSFALNLISRSAVIHKPYAHGILVRVNLIHFAPRNEDLAEWIAFWEQLQFDPSFSLLITQDTIKLLSEQQKASIRVPVNRKVWVKQGEEWVDSGRREVKITPLNEIKDVVVVRTDTPSCIQAGITKLQAATGSLAPIVEYRYFVGRALSTIKDRDKINGREVENVFSTIWGGLYNEFSGIKTAKKGTDLDNLLATLGIGQAGTPFQKSLDEFRTDERAALFKSKVTGKPRRILWTATRSARPSDSIGVVFITADVSDRQQDTGNDPIANLADSYIIAAYEVIWTKANGMNGFALFDAKGKLLEEAAPDVAADHTVPTPNTPRLQAAKSCISCHGPQDGWWKFENEVQQLFKKYPIDVFADTSQKNVAILDTLDRLAGWYQGSAEETLVPIRGSYDRATMRATGPWKNAGNQVGIIRLASQRITRIWYEDRYSTVGAKEALQEMGFVVEEGKELELIDQVLPPIIPVQEGRVTPESSTVIGLKAGLRPNRWQWQLVKSFAIERSNKVRQQMFQERKKAG